MVPRFSRVTAAQTQMETSERRELPYAGIHPREQTWPTDARFSR